MKKMIKGTDSLLHKVFGGLNVTWWGLIIFAVIAGVYTGVAAMVPFFEDTSFIDITQTFERWILFAIILIVNSRSPLDSALKTFVFFLISQPLVYLVQVPFHELGFQLLQYYKPWFIWTLCTFPMAFVGYYMKKDKWWGLLILLPMMGFLGIHYVTFFGEATHFFPQHLLSALFCAVTMFLYPLYIFKEKKIRTAGAVLAAVILLAGSVYGALDSRTHTYETNLLSSGGETCGIEYDDSYTVSLEDESFGSVEIVYMDSIETFIIAAGFEKTGETRLFLTAPDGTQTVYRLTVERHSYQVERIE